MMYGGYPQRPRKKPWTPLGKASLWLLGSGVGLCIIGVIVAVVMVVLTPGFGVLGKQTDQEFTETIELRLESGDRFSVYADERTDADECEVVDTREQKLSPFARVDSSYSYDDDSGTRWYGSATYEAPADGTYIVRCDGAGTYKVGEPITIGQTLVEGLLIGGAVILGFCAALLGLVLFIVFCVQTGRLRPVSAGR
ncbi:hypothetical protein NQ036_06565 [Brevibacterium sp. 91QC2O2]|uniref:hypothetical protein n=1 Tax=Brevibacterium TaxID=1696 RepID=UPI00211C7B99|nr:MULTISPECIES: hypothetical protein [unclassified Brevibacterium]MCQ9367908.1 hypothetical protein [Brevibacterium sp. 91QC2O2]MCQ9386360.1 hypothetical protein [Brevibacterium sp. 68QC2CO]